MSKKAEAVKAKEQKTFLLLDEFHALSVVDEYKATNLNEATKLILNDLGYKIKEAK